MSPEGSTFLFQRVPRGLDRKRLRAFQQTLTQRLGEHRAFHCLLTDDAELRRLNATFLHKDYPTDVLSFPALSGSAELGEIAISAQRAAEQAAEFGHPLETEIEVLMLHGVLHLLGHDHEKDRGRMRRLEARWRKELGLPSGLIERTRVERRRA